MNFDIMLFDDPKDYLCYVEAVHLLQHENKKRDCDFIHNKEIFKTTNEISNMEENFLVQTQRAKELFFVIDNTDYPEAVLDKNWVRTDWTGDSSEDKIINIIIETKYTSNNKYYLWTVIFIIILGVLGGLFLLSLLCYIR